MRQRSTSVIPKDLLGAEPNLGEGISRPPARARTKPYSLVVVHPKSKPMKVILNAPSKREALVYARNRWPDAAITFLPSAA
jgi:hypothetical protein